MRRRALAVLMLAAACAPSGPGTVGLVPLDATGQPLPAGPAATPAGPPASANDTASTPTSARPSTIRSPDPASYQPVTPRAVPAGPRGQTASVVDFARGAPNRVGQSVYVRDGAADRRGLSPDCGRYAADDRAQEAFLNAGGPQVDVLGLDPDGDGFACGWDPARYLRGRP